MSGKPRWACTTCGMYSSRRYSVNRHIANVHNGMANVVSFVDYLSGRKHGIYFPSPVPTYSIKQQQNEASKTANRMTDIFKEELVRSAIRRQLG